ncbi:TlyA family RNA methyltransferase [Xanthobacter sp.]|uniref:TlyA family RNA methyltransferase n=2 Tax=Xanthobacter TaxID=279 RepID=UPI0035B33C65
MLKPHSHMARDGEQDASRRMRLDRLLVERGLFDSRARAQAALAAGLVKVDGVVVAKASAEVSVGARIEAEDIHDYVSRGALKLAAGLDAFAIDPAGAEALDVGSSTGGFTEVLLRRGARRVHAVDVGRDQFHARLRDDPRVRLFEETDIRTFDPALVPEGFDLVVIDVSFIPLALVLPAALALAAPASRLVALVKPQFEAGRAFVRKGVVRDAAVRDEVCARVEQEIAALGWRLLGRIPSPIAGGDGNQEYLVGAIRP